MKTTVLAFDFGASGGRAIRAEYDGDRLSCEEVHRFENQPRVKDGHFRWDFEALLSEVETAIDKAGDFDSLGFDTWGVDFGLLDENGRLLEDPVHYRDERTKGIVEEALQTMDAETLYRETGTQILDFNTLFQLLALKKQNPELLQKAKRLLFMPDLFAYHLCGKAVCERTIASTSQLLTLSEENWNREVLEAFALPKDLLLPITASGTVIGSLPGKTAKVVAVAGHDTQCAVAAIPSQEENIAFLSCGTWSLLGCELDKPVLTRQSLELELSNELGANGKVNYLKNIIGLWLIQESRRQWRRQGQEYSFGELAALAGEAEPFRCFIDPDDPVFTPPGDMPERIASYCGKTGQELPAAVGETARCIYESLALKYRYAIEQLETVTGRKFTALHVLGGGIQATLFMQMIADATGLKVVAGPVEATALGNIIMQLVALKALPSVEAGRELIAATEKPVVYEPRNRAAWDEAWQKYRKLL